MGQIRVSGNCKSLVPSQPWVLGRVTHTQRESRNSHGWKAGTFMDGKQERSWMETFMDGKQEHSRSARGAGSDAAAS